MTQETLGLRERKMRRVRGQLIDAALHLFTRDGFEATTVDAIVREVEVSRRTFFRYFDSKEGVVLAFTDRVGDEISAGLAARPRDEPPLEAVRAALGRLVALYDAEREHALLLARLGEDTAAVRARHLNRQDRWQSRLAEDLARHLRLDAERNLQPRVVAAVALATVDVAIRAWLAQDGKGSLGPFVDEAFAALETLDRAPAPKPKRAGRGPATMPKRAARAAAAEPKRTARAPAAKPKRATRAAAAKPKPGKRAKPRSS